MAKLETTESGGITFASLARLAAFAMVVWLVIQLWELLLVLFLAILLAVTLSPIARRLQRWGMPEWAAVLTVAVILVGGISAFVFFIVPPMLEQAGAVATEWPHTRERIIGMIPNHQMIQRPLRRFLENPGLSTTGKPSEHLLSIGGLAVSGISQFGLFIVMAVYFVADGPRAYKWLRAFFAPQTRARLDETAAEVADVVFAYVAGQFITSALVFVFAAITLSILHVPGVLILALIAAVFDVLPIIGFFLSTVPSVMLAITVSPHAALAVFLAYGAYHMVENYWIVPRVYGRRLRLSTLAVLTALIAGGILAGVPGAIAILPVVASYPIVERLWLRRYVGDETIEKHEAQAAREGA